MTLVRDLYASKIQSDCVPIPAGASSALKIAVLVFLEYSVGFHMPAGAFSALKIALLVF